MLDRVRRHWVLYLLIVPVLAYFFAFLFYPMGQGIYLSFQKAGLLGPVGFIGFDNYAKVFSTPAVWQAIWNTLIIAAGITIVGTLVPILPAIALLQISPDWLKRGFQTAIYTPYLLSWVIIVGIWLNTLSPLGLVNTLLLAFGVIDQPINFFADPAWARPMVIGLTVWKDVGFHALIYLAALLSLSPDILEAADIDGANDFKKIRDILLPHLMPMIRVVFLITLLGSLRTFDSAFLMLNGRTADQIRTLAIFTYERGILNFDLGLASAAGVVLLIVSLLISGVAQIFTRTRPET
ncbi:carbohydrate ABC transporter permease [Devosia ginsengisoli]|uniref:Sugar ABC transporter permease n=1 Tax=Devosia ginsengisoli TaxID=400770 RepID=A0A5B8LUW0_9HYPH|nr:sugar ABC transporter permease [Devosia ginsengisoli]QDZ11913.1 sugar ABC transporter permease [Devosia ginsengisoli]